MNPADLPEDWNNPYRPPEVMSAQKFRSAEEKSLFWLRIFVVLQILIVVGGLGLSMYKIESIIGSGPVLVIVGAIVAFLSFRRRSIPGIVLGSSGTIFSVGIFLLINLLDWSPADAKQPVPMMISAYFAMIILLAVFVFVWAGHKRPDRERLNQSQPSDPEWTSVK